MIRSILPFRPSDSGSPEVGRPASHRTLHNFDHAVIVHNTNSTGYRDAEKEIECFRQLLKSKDLGWEIDEVETSEDPAETVKTAKSKARETSIFALASGDGCVPEMLEASEELSNPLLKIKAGNGKDLDRDLYKYRHRDDPLAKLELGNIWEVWAAYVEVRNAEGDHLHGKKHLDIVSTGRIAIMNAAINEARDSLRYLGALRRYERCRVIGLEALRQSAEAFEIDDYSQGSDGETVITRAMLDERVIAKGGHYASFGFLPGSLSDPRIHIIDAFAETVRGKRRNDRRMYAGLIAGKAYERGEEVKFTAPGDIPIQFSGESSVLHEGDMVTARIADTPNYVIATRRWI